MQKQNHNPITSCFSSFGYGTGDTKWADEPPAAMEVCGTGPYENAGRSWNSLEVAFSNGLHKPTSARFLFPRSANRLEVKIFDMRGKIVREFHVSSLSDGSSILQWDGKDSGGRLVPAGNYAVKALAHNFEQAIRIIVEK